MFGHYFKYSIKSILRGKENIFWSLIFAIALSTFMNLAFGGINARTEDFEIVKVAVVENTANDAFSQVLDAVSEGDDKLLEVTFAEADEAEQMILNEEVEGIITVDDEIKLTVRENSLSASVLESFINQYMQKEELVKKAIEVNPMNVKDVIEGMETDFSACKEVSASNGNQDNMLNYFYAIIAMSCLFASFNGLERVFNIQANISTLGARRGVAPTKKSVVIIAEFIAAHLVQFAIECITFLYMWKALGINFGERIAPVFLILYIGSACGVALGMFIGSLRKPTSKGAKIGVSIGVSMAFSIMADLCAHGIKYMVEVNLPILNRINPAVLISNAFYSLNIYDDYSKFYMNIGLLTAITVILCVVSFLRTRRTKYASL